MTKPINLKMKTNCYGGWLISYKGLLYAVKAETSRKALNQFNKTLKEQQCPKQNN